MTPFVESQTGRLTELVYLLSDRPLSLAHQAVLDAEAEDSAAEAVVQDDPWFVVASALQRLSTMSEATLWARHQQRRLAEMSERELIVAAG